MKKIIIINSIVMFLLLGVYLIIESNYLLFFISIYIFLSMGVYAYWSFKLKNMKLSIYLISSSLTLILGWIFLFKIL